MIQGLAIAGLWKPELSNRLAIHTEEDFEPLICADKRCVAKEEPHAKT